jgi:hypothetical protein
MLMGDVTFGDEHFELTVPEQLARGVEAEKRLKKIRQAIEYEKSRTELDTRILAMIAEPYPARS